MNDPSVLKSYIASNAHHDVEVFSVVFLNSQHRFLKHVEMFRGTDNQTSVYPKEIAIAALQIRASALVMCHNHPSGDPEPSEEDLRLTAEVVAAARLLDLEFLDHLVIGRGRWVSIRSQRPTIWATTAAPD
jgi:DNA repair protein RadC